MSTILWDSSFKCYLRVVCRVEDAGRYYCLVNNKEASQDILTLKVLGRTTLSLTCLCTRMQGLLLFWHWPSEALTTGLELIHKTGLDLIQIGYRSNHLVSFNNLFCFFQSLSNIQYCVPIFLYKQSPFPPCNPMLRWTVNQMIMKFKSCS